MKARILLAVMALMLLCGASNSFAQFDPDPFIPDTVRVGCVQLADVVEGDSFNVPIYIWHDEPLGGFGIGIEFDYDYVVIQSVDFTGSVLDATQQAFINKVFKPELRQAYVGFAPFSIPLYEGPTEADTASLFFNFNMRILEGAEPTRIAFDSIFVGPAGNFLLSVDADTSSDINIQAITPQFVACSAGLDVEEIPTTILPESFSLDQNVPNPFNPNTYINFAVPKTAHVTIEVYNALGQKVTTLVDETLKAGLKRVEWDGLDNSGNSVASGVYFYRMTSDSFSETKKMMLLK